jgi:phage tail-like protein
VLPAALPLTSPLVLPFTTAHFVLAIDGLTTVNFAKCTGLAAEVSVEEYQEGGENRFAHRFPTRASFPNLVLSQGAGPAHELWDWFAEFQVSGVVLPRDGAVLLMSTVEGVLAPVRVWAFTRGWPVKLTGPDLDAQASAVAIEAVEIAHHGLALKKVV